MRMILTGLTETSIKLNGKNTTLRSVFLLMDPLLTHAQFSPGSDSFYRHAVLCWRTPGEAGLLENHEGSKPRKGENLVIRTFIKQNLFRCQMTLSR